MPFPLFRLAVPMFHDGNPALAHALAGLSQPDYSGQGLFNLAVSLGRVCGAPSDARYPELRLPGGEAASEVWQHYQTVVFFLMDGLGDAFLSANRALAPNLWRDRVAQISSVFPSTTATAITTLMTCQPAAAHGLLGWFVRDETSGSIVAPLPMRERGSAFGPDEGVVRRLLRSAPMLAAAHRRTHLVTLKELTRGAYSDFYAAGARVHAYSRLEQLPQSVSQAAREDSGPCYVYAYTPLLDRTAHDFGVDSAASRAVLQQLDVAYAAIRSSVPEALVIVAADHGLIDNPVECQIDLAEHSDLLAMLRSPLSGERRAAYCHVKPEYVAEFGRLIEERFGDALLSLPAAQAFACGLFGPCVADAETYSRAGDWVLLARANWTIQDHVAGEKSHPMIGVHGGLSVDEMRVPLILGVPVT